MMSVFLFLLSNPFVTVIVDTKNKNSFETYSPARNKNLELFRLITFTKRAKCFYYFFTN